MMAKTWLVWVRNFVTGQPIPQLWIDDDKTADGNKMIHLSEKERSQQGLPPTIRIPVPEDELSLGLARIAKLHPPESYEPPVIEEKPPEMKPPEVVS
jgi:hypothetical protein